VPADEVTHGADVDGSRERARARHAAPKRPLFTRFHMPAGKAIAMAAMPTAVLVGMGFTSSLALADGGGSAQPSSKSLTADEYKDCVAALDDASASPSPSASESKADDKATPSPSASADASKDAKDAKDSSKDSSGKAGSSDSGSDDKATPTPSASESSKGATPSPSTSASGSGDGGGLLGGLGDALGGLLGGGSSSSSASPSASASPSPSASKDASSTSTSGKSVTDTVKDTTKKVTDTVDGTVKDATGKVSKTVDDATKAAGEAASSAASPSASPGADAEDCPAATDDEGGVDNKVAVADDPWYLSASSLLLKKADYQGVVKVKTANGTTKKVLKYVISGGTDIGDLHQTVKDKQQGKTYHVQAGSGTTSTIRDGDTTMYTESISGNLFGLVPITFSPDSPPPLNIPLIYFTNVKVVQAAQFGGSLHVPGMHVYTTDGTG
jgi:hypothetical protein